MVNKKNIIKSNIGPSISVRLFHEAKARKREQAPRSIQLHQRQQNLNSKCFMERQKHEPGRMSQLQPPKK